MPDLPPKPASRNEDPPQTSQGSHIPQTAPNDGAISSISSLGSAKSHTKSPSGQSADAPPLPDEPIPKDQEDDGWSAHQDPATGGWYFHNKFTGATQWNNPRVPEASNAAHQKSQQSKGTGAAGGYNPAIHGDYDPNADYARKTENDVSEDPFDSTLAAVKEGGYNPYDASTYGSAAQFNRFTGLFHNQSRNASHDPDHHSDAAKSSRQLNAFFDADAAANSHDGKSLKAERQQKKLTKAEVKAYNEQRRAKKEAKRKKWLME